MSEPNKPPPLPPAPVHALSNPASEQPAPFSIRPPWYTILHPWSGGLLLLIDNVCFGANAMTGFLATPLVIVVAFITVFIGVYRIQRQRAKNSRWASFAKALFCGILAGVPWSVAGTAVGGLVMLLSGTSSGINRK